MVWTSSYPRSVRTLLGFLLALTLLVTGAGAASAATIEDYAPYQPQDHCSPRAKVGTLALSHFLIHHFGGSFGGISRSCTSGGTSEHKEGRAFDWSLDARSRHDRKIAQAFMEFAFAADKHGDEDAKARRMGIMYIIWNDHMYEAWNGFERGDYLASSCKKISKCSTTLRHRNHMHISLDRTAAKGRTSWYDGRVTP